MSSKFRLLLGCFLFAILGSAGCSKNPDRAAKISGKVTKNGSPITAGTISFTIADHGCVTVGIRSDGTYEVPELPIGEAVVTIETESANPDRKQEYKGGQGGSEQKKMYGKKAGIAQEHDTPAEMSPKPPGAKAAQGTYTQIPARYADPAQSKLSVTLKSGTNKKDFDLTD